MDKAPLFSIVVSTRNRPEHLAGLLEAIARQEFDDFETVVVDDGSRPALTVGSGRVRLVRHEKSRGPAAGRNTGVSAARGKYLAFTDDDCRPDREWLRRLKESLERDPGAMIGGLVVNGLVENLCSSASQYIHDLVYAHYNRDPRRSRFFATNNMAVAREAFLELGGFSTEYGFASEDRDFCDRWVRSGRAMIFDASALVTHLHSLTLAGYCRQHFAYGFGAADFHRRSAARGGEFSEHVAFHRGALSWFAGLFRSHAVGRAMAMSALLVVWQVANACGFFYGRWRR